jgi:hypothetical protein
MKSILKLGFILITAMLLVTSVGVKKADAASSALQFAVPVETIRYKWSLAMVRADNTMQLVPIQGELKTATVNASGSKVAYVIRDNDRLKVYTCDPQGKNQQMIVDYRSDKRNMQDFIDVLFTNNGNTLLMAKFIKAEISFLEYDFKKGQPRFLNKTEWKGMPFVVHSLDPGSGGQLVFKMDSHEGGGTTQQVWTMSAHTPGTSLFLELESPPTIIHMIPDMKNKRVIASCANTRNVAVRDQMKSMMIIDSVKKEPKSIIQDLIFDNLTISGDGNAIIWRCTKIGSDMKFKKYDLRTGKISSIPAEESAEKGT